MGRGRLSRECEGNDAASLAWGYSMSPMSSLVMAIFYRMFYVYRGTVLGLVIVFCSVLLVRTGPDIPHALVARRSGSASAPRRARLGFLHEKMNKLVEVLERRTAGRPAMRSDAIQL